MIWSHNVKITGNDQPRQHRCQEDYTTEIRKLGKKVVLEQEN